MQKGGRGGEGGAFKREGGELEKKEVHLSCVWECYERDRVCC